MTATRSPELEHRDAPRAVQQPRRSGFACDLFGIQGRADPLLLWWVYLAAGVGYAVFGALGGLAAQSGWETVEGLLALAALAWLYGCAGVFAATCVRRLRDLDTPSTLSGLLLIPVVNLLWLGWKPGGSLVNEYGAPTRDRPGPQFWPLVVAFGLVALAA